MLGYNGEVRVGQSLRSTDASGGDDRIQTGAGSDAIIGGGGNDRILTGLDGVTDVALGDSGLISMSGPAMFVRAESLFESVGGNDYIETSGGADAVLGGAGNDEIFDSATNDVLLGDNGVIRFSNGLPVGVESRAGSGGNDTITSLGGGSAVIGGDGADTIVATGGKDFLFIDFEDTHMNGNWSLGLMGAREELWLKGVFDELLSGFMDDTAKDEISDAERSLEDVSLSDHLYEVLDLDRNGAHGVYVTVLHVSTPDTEMWIVVQSVDGTQRITLITKAASGEQAVESISAAQAKVTLFALEGLPVDALMEALGIAPNA